VERLIRAVTQLAAGKLAANYEQADDGTFSPVGGWPPISRPLQTLARPIRLA
jgi:hypothetical protein